MVPVEILAVAHAWGRAGGRSFLTRVVLCALAATLPSVSAHAQSSSGPVIASIWGETAEGQTLRILGTGFGAHALEVASSIGPEGWIESNPAGTRFNALVGAQGWDVGQASGTPEITSERSHSGRNAVLGRVDFAADGNWQSVMRYEHLTSFTKLYASFWIYWDPIRSSPHRSTQLKLWRINHNGTVSDQAGQIYFSSRHRDSGEIWDFQWTSHCTLGCDGDDYRLCYRDALPDPFYPPRFDNPAQYGFLNKADARPWTDAHPQPRSWSRVEIYVDRGRTDAFDGSLEYRILQPGSGTTFSERLTRLLLGRSDRSCRNPQDPWRFFQMQNYWDDDGSHDAPSFQNERADFFYDDIYLQFGTQARVELGDAPTFEACTRREIQDPLRWEDGAIRIELQRGGFERGETCHLFVVDASGRASAGMPIMLR